MLTFFISELINEAQLQNKIITTESTTKIIDKLIKEVDGEVKRVENTPGAVSSVLRFERYDFGGSDSGKYRFPEYAPFSDTVLTTLKILETIVSKNLKLSELIQRVPKSIKVYKEISVDETILQGFAIKIRNNLSNHLQDYKLIDTLIGIKIFLGPDKGYITVNPNLGQNLLLMSAETEDKKECQNLFSILEEIILEN